MLNKKSMKVISIVILAIVLLMSIGSTVFAGNGTAETAETAGIASNFEPDTTAIAGSSANSVIKTVLGALKWIGVAIAVGMLIFLGIKYVTSAPEGKANLKGQLGVYVLGFVFIVAATTVVGILETTLQF